MLARTLASQALVSKCIGEGLSRHNEQPGAAPPTAAAAGATGTLPADSSADNPARTAAVPPSASAETATGPTHSALELPSADAPFVPPPMLRMRSVTFLTGAQPRSRPGSGSSVASRRERSPALDAQAVPASAPAADEAGRVRGESSQGAGQPGSGTSSSWRPGSRESHAVVRGAALAAGGSAAASCAGTPSGSTKGATASLDTQLGPSRQGSADALALPPDATRPPQLAGPTPAETEVVRGHRLSAAVGQTSAVPVRRLSQVSSMPNLSLLERRKSTIRPAPVCTTIPASSRGALSSNRPVSAASSYAVSTPGRPPAADRAAPGRAKSGFTPRFLPSGYSRAPWAHTILLGGAGAGDAPPGSGRRRKEIHQQYAMAWRETEALLGEYSMLRDAYEREWLGVERRAPPAHGQPREAGAAGVKAAHGGARVTARPQPTDRASDNGPRGRAGAGAGAGAVGVRRSPFVEEYLARKAEVAALVYSESEEGIAAAAAGSAERDIVEKSCLDLLGRSSDECETELVSMRQQRADQADRSASACQGAAVAGTAAAAPTAVAVLSRLARPASAPNLALSGRLALRLQQGDSLSALVATAPAPAVAMDVHNPRAALPATQAGARPSAADPRTATEMRIRQLAQRTAREAARDRMRDGMRGSTAGAPPPVRLWSAPPRRAVLGTPLRASGSTASLCLSRPAGIPPPPNQRLLATSASHPCLTAVEWRIRPGSSPAW